MPLGVEHSGGITHQPFSSVLNITLMPLGVEHNKDFVDELNSELLNITLMPLGVEHLITTGTLIAVAI